MEININFSIRSLSNLDDLIFTLSKIQSSMVQEYANDYFGPGDFEVFNSNGDCIATYNILGEPNDENFYPFNCIDYSDDAEALASAGFGTDEDYGYYGEDDY